MKGKNTILFGAALLLVLAVGCSAGDDARRPDPHPCDAECEAQIQADREYLAKNSPTHEHALQVRECVTARTGYEYPDELPDDDGPSSATLGTPEPARPIQEDMPFRLVERALVAVGQRKPLGERVNVAEVDCVYELGLEDRYYPPRTRGTFRPSNS